jgi:hypothetical protein
MRIAAADNNGVLCRPGALLRSAQCLQQAVKDGACYRELFCKRVGLQKLAQLVVLVLQRLHPRSQHCATFIEQPLLALLFLSQGIPLAGHVAQLDDNVLGNGMPAFRAAEPKQPRRPVGRVALVDPLTDTGYGNAERLGSGAWSTGVNHQSLKF